MRGAFPISLLMPLSPRRVPPRLFLPWAANLLPEATQLKAIGLQLGASPGDVIGILSELGRDTAGALSIGKPGTANPDWRPVPNDKALERILAELPCKAVPRRRGRRVHVARRRADQARRRHRRQGPHLRADQRRAVDVDPEAGFAEPLRQRAERGAVPGAGAGASASTRRRSPPARRASAPTCMVTRYDRVEQSGRWRRLHQEDFCQALGKPPSAKYESNQTGIPGPTLAEMFAVTRNAMQAPDVVHLLDYVIFNVLACNTDAHAKNYSLMISGKGFKLAPIYDVMCALAWEHVTRNIAQKIAGKSRGEHLKRRHWQRFAADVGLNAPRLIARVETLAKAALIETRNAAADVAAMPAGAHPLMQQVTRSHRRPRPGAAVGADGGRAGGRR